MTLEPAVLPGPPISDRRCMSPRRGSWNGRPYWERVNIYDGLSDEQALGVPAPSPLPPLRRRRVGARSLGEQRGNLPRLPVRATAHVWQQGWLPQRTQRARMNRVWSYYTRLLGWNEQAGMQRAMPRASVCTRVRGNSLQHGGGGSRRKRPFIGLPGPSSPLRGRLTTAPSPGRRRRKAAGIRFSRLPEQASGRDTNPILPTPPAADGQPNKRMHVRGAGRGAVGGFAGPLGRSPASACATGTASSRSTVVFCSRGAEKVRANPGALTCAACMYGAHLPIISRLLSSHHPDLT